MTAKWARFAAISCTHCPHQSERAIESLLKQLKGRDLTHFIHLGDIVNADASSQWNSDPAEHSLYDEFIVAASVLRRIRKALPADCQLIAFDGNHDDNIQKQGRIQHDLRSLLNPRNLDGVKEEYRRWKHVPYRYGKSGTYTLGSIIFAHGFAAGGNSDELESIALANECHGVLANQLVIRGHTHRPVPPTQCRRTARVKLPLWFANAGYMAFGESGRAEYTYRFSISEWKHACIFGETQLGRIGRMSRDSWKAELVLL